MTHDNDVKDQCREAFEKHFRYSHKFERSDTGVYLDNETFDRWTAWLPAWKAAQSNANAPEKKL